MVWLPASVPYFCIQTGISLLGRSHASPRRGPGGCHPSSAALKCRLMWPLPALCDPSRLWFLIAARGRPRSREANVHSRTQLWPASCCWVAYAYGRHPKGLGVGAPREQSSAWISFGLQDVQSISTLRKDGRIYSVSVSATSVQPSRVDYCPESRTAPYTRGSKRLMAYWAQASLTATETQILFDPVAYRFGNKKCKRDRGVWPRQMADRLVAPDRFVVRRDSPVRRVPQKRPRSTG